MCLGHSSSSRKSVSASSRPAPAIAYLVIFLLILFIYEKEGPKSVGSGLYFGLCLTLIFTFRFFVEYTKEIQVAFEAGLPMDMGQIFSLPLIIAGVRTSPPALSGQRKRKTKHKYDDRSFVHPDVWGETLLFKASDMVVLWRPWYPAYIYNKV